MLKFCTFCGRKLDTEGFCTNSKCPDYKRKELIETEKKMLAEKQKAPKKLIIIRLRGCFYYVKNYITVFVPCSTLENKGI